MITWGNRGNGRQQVFHKDEDNHAFLRAIEHGCIEVPMRLLGYCLMPNHDHLVVWPLHDGDLPLDALGFEHARRLQIPQAAIRSKIAR